MTIKEIIEEIDEVKPNAYSDRQKMRWISQLDGKIAADLMLMAPEEIQETFTYHYPEDLKTEPLVYPPHDDIYPAWLAAKIDEMDHEAALYANSMTIYNAIYQNFAAWVLNTYDPAQGG